MISIIICNRGNEINKDLENNIIRTIGAVDYEIISINNEDGKYNIFQAYNIGVEKARFPYLCFMHDDIRFHTSNWGNNVVNHFSDKQVGMIGVAGPTYLSRTPGVWWGINSLVNQTYSTRQRNIDTNRLNPHEQHTTNNNPFEEKVSEVVALDGLFFCIRKDLFNVIKFDEKYGGFHFYDIDISMQVFKLNYRILCVYDILVEHISVSNLSVEWIESSRTFYNKWETFLPIQTFPFKRSVIRKMERNNMQTMFNLLTAVGVPLFQYYTIKEICRMICTHPFFFLRKLCKRLF